MDLCHRQKPKVKGEKQENIQMFLTVKKSVGIFKTGTKLVIFKNHETSMYRCPLSSCKKETKVPDSLRKHIIRGTCFKEDISDDIVIPFELFYTPFCLNLKYKMLTCLECKILVASKDTFDHMRDNHSEEFYYYICWTAFTQMVNYHKIEETELSFFNKFPLSDHEFSQIYGLETTKGFSCSVCSFIFADRDGFNRHHHKDLYETMEIPRSPVEVNFQFLKKKSHKVVYHDSVETAAKVYDESQRKKPGVNGVEEGFCNIYVRNTALLCLNELHSVLGFMIMLPVTIMSFSIIFTLFSRNYKRPTIGQDLFLMKRLLPELKEPRRFKKAMLVIYPKPLLNICAYIITLG